MTAKEIAEKYTWNIIISRWVAAWIDLIVLFLFILIPNLTLGDKIYHNTSDIWVTIACLYFPICEGYFGLTIGKLVTKIRVVDNDLKSPGFLKAIIRTVFRIVEVNPILLGGIPAGIIVYNSKQRQRLGDKFAQTYVLRINDIQEAKNNQNQFNSF